jgi:hypothetical protein
LPQAGVQNGFALAAVEAEIAIIALDGNLHGRERVMALKKSSSSGSAALELLIPALGPRSIAARPDLVVVIEAIKRGSFIVTPIGRPISEPPRFLSMPASARVGLEGLSPTLETPCERRSPSRVLGQHPLGVGPGSEAAASFHF